MRTGVSPLGNRQRCASARETYARCRIRYAAPDMGRIVEVAGTARSLGTFTGCWYVRQRPASKEARPQWRSHALSIFDEQKWAVSVSAITVTGKAPMETRLADPTAASTAPGPWSTDQTQGTEGQS